MNEPRGFFPRLGAALFGEHAQRLRERANRTHWLSYLLIVSQSIAVVLVFGHVEVAYLLDPSLAIRLLAMGALFLLIITVIAADLALVETMTRIPVLKRNRQAGALFEHRAYQLFVLAVEGATYGVVLYTLDSDPQALTQGRSLIPTTGPIFLTLVVMRVLLISWSAVQLIIVRGHLPVLLTTLTNTVKEIVGAHIERQLETMEIGDIATHALFGVYAEATRPPRPIAGLLNALTGGWIVRRALAQEVEEERQANNVMAAMTKLQRPPHAPQMQSSLSENTPHYTAEHAIEAVRRDLRLVDYPPTSDDKPQPPTDDPPRGLQRRAAASSEGDAADDVTPDGVVHLPTQRRRRSASNRAIGRGSNPSPVRTPSRTPRTRRANINYEPLARAAWDSGAQSVGRMMRATGMSRTAASSWVRTMKAEHATTPASAQEGA